MHPLGDSQATPGVPQSQRQFAVTLALSLVGPGSDDLSLGFGLFRGRHGIFLLRSEAVADELDSHVIRDVVGLSSAGPYCLSQQESAMTLQKFIIERDITKVGAFEREQLRGAAAKSNEVLRQLGPDIQWVESYVADDKTFCVYLAKDEAIIRKHAEISGFPATKITEVKRMIDPTTAA